MQKYIRVHWRTGMKGKYRKYGRMGMGICALPMKAADGGITVKPGMGALNGGKEGHGGDKDGLF